MISSGVKIDQFNKFVHFIFISLFVSRLKGDLTCVNDQTSTLDKPYLRVS